MKFEEAKKFDPVNRPKHYTSHPSGIECIRVTEHMNFCLGNAVKYIWRADEKDNDLEDLKKAAWYIAREIERREKKLIQSAENICKPSKSPNEQLPLWIITNSDGSIFYIKDGVWTRHLDRATLYDDFAAAKGAAIYIPLSIAPRIRLRASIPSADIK